VAPFLVERVAGRVQGDLAAHHVVVDGGEGEPVVGAAVAQDRAHLGLQAQVEVVGDTAEERVGLVVLDLLTPLRGVELGQLGLATAAAEPTP
jgi:hypothetical protein